MPEQPNAIPFAKMSDVSGPAFPACNEANLNGTMGMSLRDWFAGQALNGILAATVTRVPSVEAPVLRRLKSEDAYALADAMLAVRATTPAESI